MDALVLQTDFGLVDGAVSAMHGVARQVSPDLQVSDLTHDIPQYDIWSAAYRLIQTLEYWPAGTVFVSVVDPGVGSDRRSVAVKTRDGKYVITPDNGTLTHLLAREEIVEARQIDESKSRLPHSQESHTFHGRDIYAYNGARLASGQVDFAGLGHDIPVASLTKLPVAEASYDQGVLRGIIDIHDIRFGSLWTNISSDLIRQAGIKNGDHLVVKISHQGKAVYQNIMPFVRSFAQVAVGEPLAYVNSLVNLGIAVNQDSFSKLYNIGLGVDWQIEISKAPAALVDLFNQ